MNTLLSQYRNAPYETFELIMRCKECESDETVIHSILHSSGSMDIYAVKCEECDTELQLTPEEAQIVEDFLGL